ncbi:hypothetical protein [Paraburkholderia sp. BL10I2N1]|uniref:hypothetical protein n=1 Tax=Paraburkholderia sp. BL10I2N1 TaxID=1938796 RepID=UPI00105F1FC4|nr:hypothetical protein [Paraburkholderia sp. BL10I2N1]TDN70456.1 hypothetical protein B0G77_3930 [Paraburkholderia sp. BL10I2N1]
MDMRATPLCAKAMLVKLTIRRANLSRRDAAAETLIQQTLDDASLIVSSKLFRDKANPVNRIMSTAAEVYTYHKKHTLPWADKGPRLLPNGLYFEYRDAMRHRIAQVDAMLNEHMPHYDSYVSTDIACRSKSLGAASRAQVGDYPSAEQFRERMGFDLRFSPLPDSQHFLFDLSAEDQAGFEQALTDARIGARNDAVRRMLEPTQHLVSRLNVPIGENGSIFRDSALTNVVEGIDLARKLTLDEDPDITAVTEELAKAVRKCVDGKELLRESPATREAAVKKLEQLASQMSAFMVGV